MNWFDFKKSFIIGIALIWKYFDTGIGWILESDWDLEMIEKGFEKCLDGTRKGWQCPSFRGDAAEIL